MPTMRRGDPARLVWDLGHDDRDPSWTRPEHRSCNRATSGRRRAMPLRWSRRWFDDPAVGTEVTLGGGLVEIYIGRGIMAEVRERGQRRNAPLAMRPYRVQNPDLVGLEPKARR